MIALIAIVAPIIAIGSAIRNCYCCLASAAVVVAKIALIIGGIVGVIMGATLYSNGCVVVKTHKRLSKKGK